MSVTLLGIRHHGPGSCRHVVQYLNELKPDLILLEAPSDVAPMLDFVPTLTQAQESPLPPVLSHKAEDKPEVKNGEPKPQPLPDMLRPPVALMAYQSDQPKNSAFYPFAEFSPEWQTMLYGKEHRVEVRPFDLPLSYTLAMRAAQIAKEEEGAAALAAQLAQETEQAAAEQTAGQTAAEQSAGQAAVAKQEEQDAGQVLTAETELKDEAQGAEPADAEAQDSPEHLVADPFDYLAELEGMADGEQWWESRIEQRLESKDIFAAVELAVTALRENLPEHSSKRDLVREAWMRKELRAAVKEVGAEGKIAVVCGAWHVPALAQLASFKVKDDNALIKELPKPLNKNKVGITWIPWTYSRLSYYSGYGAGINAPGWYHHVFLHPDDDGTLWLTHVAEVLRGEGFDISVAHVMEAVRLARTLAALRGLNHPTLAEFNEAVTTVMGMGDDVVLRSVARALVIADRIGTIPSKVPMVPLLADITATQKHLRQPFVEGIKEVILDLRKPLDLERSVFFHRLNLLGIAWAKEEEASGRGTFKEKWQLEYRPELIVHIIERAIYGNTLLEAVVNYVQAQMQEHPELQFITKLLEQVMTCDLPDLVAQMSARINDLAAQASDMHVLLESLPPLCAVVRYGNVRKFDFSAVCDMLETMLTRIKVGGFLMCININDDAARELKDHLGQVNLALNTLNDEACSKIWHDFITKVQASGKVHPLISGCSTRLMRDHHTITNELILQALSYYSSVGNTPNDIAFWFEGFLENSGTVLLLDDVLWGLVNSFICNLDDESFTQVLPILRRTFATFEQHERTKLGQKAKNFDPDKATQTLPVAAANSGLPDDKLARPVINLVCSFLGVNLPAA